MSRPMPPPAAAAARYTVGIDLGTSHTVVAYADLWAAANADGGGDSIHLLPMDQLIASGEVAAPALLASVRYHPAPGELSATELALPWHSAWMGGSMPGMAGMADSTATYYACAVPPRMRTPRPRRT